MANKIKLDLRSLTVPDKVQFMRQVVTKLTGNADFTTPSPSLVTIGDKADALEAAYNLQQTTQQSAKAATTSLGTAEDAADAAMNSLAGYVEEKSGGVPAKIQSTGLNTRAPKTPTTTLDAPQNFTLTAGDNEGELDAHWDPVDRSRGYELQISDDPPTPTSWRPGDLPSGSKTTITGQLSGSKLWGRVRALGPKKVKSPWSDPAVKRVP